MGRVPIKDPALSAQYEELSRRRIGDVVRLRENRKKAFIVINKDSRWTQLLSWYDAEVVLRPNTLEAKKVDAKLLETDESKVGYKFRFPRNKSSGRRLSTLKLEQFTSGEVVTLKSNPYKPYIFIKLERGQALLFDWVDKSLAQTPKDTRATRVNVELVDVDKTSA